MIIKLCGLRRPEDIAYINEARPDFAGFILAEGYRRTISPETASELVKQLDSAVKAVGVFIDQPVGFVADTAKKAGFYAVQLQGNEDAGYISDLRKISDAKIWKAVRVKSAEDIYNAEGYGADMLVLDSYSPAANGGTGKTADWELIRKTNISMPYLLAGGITAENISEAMKISGYGIDISGGTETDGVKDPVKIKTIMNLVRKVDKNV